MGLAHLSPVLEKALDARGCERMAYHTHKHLVGDCGNVTAGLGGIDDMHRASDGCRYNLAGDVLHLENSRNILDQVHSALSYIVELPIDASEESDKRAYAPDGLHFSDAGHRVIADMLGKFILSI